MKQVRAIRSLWLAAAIAATLVGCGGGNDGTIDALTLCQMALKKVSRDPEKADVPYVSEMGKGGDFFFAWGPDTKMARMRNGLGLEVAATASCTVDRQTGKLKTLSLNGQTIL